MMVQGYAFSRDFWALDRDVRKKFLADAGELIRLSSSALPHFRMYSSLRNDMDLIFWYSARDVKSLLKFKLDMLESMKGYVDSVYGSFSIYRESPYLKAGQDLMDTLNRDPMPYFVAYPMSKENSWYQLEYEERKKVMSEHIGVAVSHPDNRNIRSYTTYSFGISDGEFMVIYELDDFSKWSSVTARLREVRARTWIRDETPIITGVHTGTLTV